MTEESKQEHVCINPSGLRYISAVKTNGRPSPLLATSVCLAASLLCGATTPPTDSVPLFARFATYAAKLQSYTVPLHVDVTLRKIIRIRVSLNGSMHYERPDDLTLALGRVPQQQREFFAKLATPRTWPMNYDLEVTGTTVVDGHTHYAINGVPKDATDGVDHLVADVSDDDAPVLKVQWFLRAGGSITMQVATAAIGKYVLPTREQVDVNIPGHRLHADISYGTYVLNDRSMETASR